MFTSRTITPCSFPKLDISRQNDIASFPGVICTQCQREINIKGERTMVVIPEKNPLKNYHRCWRGFRGCNYTPYARYANMPRHGINWMATYIGIAIHKEVRRFLLQRGEASRQDVSRCNGKKMRWEIALEGRTVVAILFHSTFLSSSLVSSDYYRVGNAFRCVLVLVDRTLLPKKGETCIRKCRAPPRRRYSINAALKDGRYRPLTNTCLSNINYIFNFAYVEAVGSYHRLKC